MLDENLPAFFIKPNTDGVKHHEAFLLSHYGSEPEPIYDLHKLDPASPNSKNVYAAALFDSFNPEILYGEVLVKPEWTHPTLSQEEIRKNGGVAPPPQPLHPVDFTLQLYNPDQQVKVEQKTSKFSSTNWYEFSMPQQSFRYPSASTLDRGRHDPAADPTIPKINFVWKRDSKFGKDMLCYMTGKSTDPNSKKKGGKEPDIAVALFKGLKEVTIYESNFHRIDMEDYKGLEIVLLLSAIIIRDVYFGQIYETFHVFDQHRKNSGGLFSSRKNSSPTHPSALAPGSVPALATSSTAPAPQHLLGGGAALGGLYNAPPPSGTPNKHSGLPPLQTGHGFQPNPRPGTDPRTQWEIDAETARLRAEANAEAANARRAAEQRAKERAAQQKADEDHAKRLKKQMEAEEKERRRKQAEVDRETERLKKIYGTQGQDLRPPMHGSGGGGRHSAPLIQQPFARPTGSTQQPVRLSNGLWSSPGGSSSSSRPQQPPRPANYHSGPYLAPTGSRPVASSSGFFGGGGNIKPDSGQTLSKPKKSFWGLRSHSDGNVAKLSKKQSSMF
jgi:hypothetical protein